MNTKNNHMLSNSSIPKVIQWLVSPWFFFIIQLTERIAQVCENNRLAKESKTKALNRIISLTSLLKITPLTGK